MDELPLKKFMIQSKSSLSIHMIKKNTKMKVRDNEISVALINEQDYICLTDMAKGFDGDGTIKNWLRNRNTLEFLGVWEQMNNPNFNLVEFDRIRREAGLNRFTVSVKEWIESTNAIGITARAGRYGGTYTHKDIAFEFGSWLSPEFKLLLIKEFQRLKQDEREGLHWDTRRMLAKVNYRIHTDAVKDILVAKAQLPKSQTGKLYADEAELLNLALFGYTSKDWREKNPSSAAQGNIRDFASIEQLTVLSNLESLNSMLIRDNINMSNRYQKLREVARDQLKSLAESKIKLDKISKELGDDLKKKIPAINPQKAQ